MLLLQSVMRNLVLTLAVALGVFGAGEASAAPAPLGVMIASSNDASPGVLDARVRKRHGEIVRRALLDVLHRSGADVRHSGRLPRQIDIAIVAWHIVSTADQIRVSADLRVVLCDGHGRILSIVTGRARLTVPRLRARLPELREQVLAEAVAGMTRSLQSQLDHAS